MPCEVLINKTYNYRHSSEIPVGSQLVSSPKYRKQFWWTLHLTTWHEAKLGLLQDQHLLSWPNLQFKPAGSHRAASLPAQTTSLSLLRVLWEMLVSCHPDHIGPTGLLRRMGQLHSTQARWTSWQPSWTLSPATTSLKPPCLENVDLDGLRRQSAVGKAQAGHGSC